MAIYNSIWARSLILASTMALGVLGDNILSTSGFTNCNGNSTIVVNKVDITYNNDNKTVTFDVSGTSTKIQNVTAILNVTAYGQQVYSNSFNPCAASTFVQQLCPVPAGTFGATGSQAIPAQYADLVPSIAFQIPDIAAQATLQLKSLEDGSDAGCVKSEVSNGKTASVPAVSYVAASIAGAALALTGASAISAMVSGAGSVGGMGTVSPSFTEIFGVFQGFAMNGMMSVNYPAVYRSFTKNFAFSTGLIPWTQMQQSIDNFRNMTGGNLTEDSIQYLQNATLVFPDGSTTTPDTTSAKRSIEEALRLAVRQITTSVNSTATTGDSTSGTETTLRSAVSGIQGYVEMLSVPQANTFMTVLLIVAIVIAAIAVGILFVKVVLELWAVFGNFPKSLTGFRKHYWGSIARAITSLILLLYGVWVLYCIFQFTHGDSWAAKVLAGVTLALFTGILAFFSYKIWTTARKLREAEGDTSGLYEEKSIWVKYSLFYESYKKSYWWLFIPSIVYLFAKGCVLAAADGHGMIQSISLLVIEALMLILLLWSRPYERKSGNIINIVIQVVRVLSVCCVLVFVEEFGIAETTQTVTGVVLIAIQSALSGILAILIAYNAIVACCKENPHRKRRKEMEKTRSMDTLTPLDAHNSLLMERNVPDIKRFSIPSTIQETAEPPSRNFTPTRLDVPTSYHMRQPSMGSPFQSDSFRPLTPTPRTPVGPNHSRENLIPSAAPMSMQPTIPNLGGYGQPYAATNNSNGYNGGGYKAGGYQPYNPLRGY